MRRTSRGRSARQESVLQSLRLERRDRLRCNAITKQGIVDRCRFWLRFGRFSVDTRPIRISGRPNDRGSIRLFSGLHGVAQSISPEEADGCRSSDGSIRTANDDSRSRKFGPLRDRSANRAAPYRAALVARMDLFARRGWHRCAPPDVPAQCFHESRSLVSTATGQDMLNSLHAGRLPVVMRSIFFPSLERVAAFSFWQVRKRTCPRATDREQIFSLDRSFRDAAGHSSQNSVKDFTSGLYEEMPVSVFYNEDDPSQNVALESSLFRLR
jgi:hypothetical protein